MAIMTCKCSDRANILIFFFVFILFQITSQIDDKKDEDIVAVLLDSPTPQGLKSFQNLLKTCTVYIFAQFIDVNNYFYSKFGRLK